ncbi:glycosyltransferase family 4 protein [Kiritimatiellaeota bacterium B1221]|nr:glycosyltransferase family 4 protein [Kiritimatiellaeota bacterium B1221]
MKILIMTSSGEPLNSIRPEAEIFLGLHRGGHPVTIMTGRKNVYWDRWVEAGIEMIDYEPAKRLGFTDVKFMRNWLKEHPVDVAYLFNNKAICNTAFAARGLPVKLVAYRGQTGNIYWYDPSCYLTILHPRLDGVSCVSNAVRDDLRKHLMKPQKAVTVYKGHDLEWYQDSPADLSFLNLPAHAFVVGCTANNRPRKGVPVLVEAMGLLPADAEIHLLLIGKGMDAPELLEQINASPAADKIHRLGFRNDAPALTAACDCTVLPAVKREGLPKTVIESMVYEVPAITTDTGGSAELMIDGESGFVVPPHDPAAIADRIMRLFTNQELAESMGKAGRVRIDEHFHVNQSIEKTREWFQSLTA